MNIAAQVSVGSRDLVLENGPDVMNSSDEEPRQKSTEKNWKESTWEESRHLFFFPNRRWQDKKL
jgi:hypothetical protein